MIMVRRQALAIDDDALAGVAGFLEALSVFEDRPTLSPVKRRMNR
jgi:hypothetical protein